MKSNYECCEQDECEQRTDACYEIRCFVNNVVEVAFVNLWKCDDGVQEVVENGLDRSADDTQNNEKVGNSLNSLVHEHGKF